MASLTDLALQKALNISGVSPTYLTDQHLFQVGSKVWRLADLPANGSNLANTPSYTVLAVGFKVANDGSSNEQVLDQELNAALPCDAQTPKIPAAGVAGFTHTTTLSAAVAANTGSRPWFYRIQRNTDNAVLEGIHEHQLNNEVNWTTYVGSKLADIIA